MNRRGFLKFLSIAPLVAVAGPKLLTEKQSCLRHITKIHPYLKRLQVNHNPVIFEKVLGTMPITVTKEVKSAYSLDVGDYIDLTRVEADEKGLMGAGRYRRVL